MMLPDELNLADHRFERLRESRGEVAIRSGDRTWRDEAAARSMGRRGEP